MDDSDTETVELERHEARAVIDALSSYRAGTTGREERRALNVETFLQREFGFDDDDFVEGRDIVESFADVFDAGDDESQEIQLSRAEAEEVVSALERTDDGASSDEATRTELGNRFRRRFELEAHSGA